MARPLTYLAGRLALVLGLAISLGCDSPPAGPEEETSPAAERASPSVLGVLGLGPVRDRFTSEVWVHGGFAYTGTWGRRSGTGRGDAVKIWNVRGSTPVLVESYTIGPDSVATIGDVQVSDDGKLLVIATEPAPHGSLRIFDLEDPARPRLLAVHATPNTANGVHTAEVARVGGKLYAFLSIDPSPSRLVIVDLSDPSNPREVYSAPMGNPFIHDVFVRDGILFTALWNEGLGIWDIGGRGAGTPVNPVRIATIRTAGGQVHNAWWYHAPDGKKQYVFVGQEGPATIGVNSSGDIHVVDVSELSAPREVAFFNVPGAGTHNFSMDEARGTLFAAYYNAGVRALDVRGDLGQCSAAQRSGDGRCDLGAMGREIGRWLTDGSPYVWGVQWVNGSLYASDMLSGLYRLDPAGLRP